MTRRYDGFLTEKIVVAGYVLERQAKASGAPSAAEGHFNGNDLVVQAWKMHPHDLGLPGYENMYPDSRRILAVLWDRGRGTVLNGWFEKVAVNLYRITEKGREKAREVLGWETVKPVEKPAPGLPPEIRDLYFSEVFRKHKAGQPISFAEACQWWGITENMTQKKALEKLTVFGRELRMHDEYPEARSLFNVHEQLVARFEKYLQLLRAAV